MSRQRRAAERASTGPKCPSDARVSAGFPTVHGMWRPRLLFDPACRSIVHRFEGVCRHDPRSFPPGLSSRLCVSAPRRRGSVRAADEPVPRAPGEHPGGRRPAAGDRRRFSADPGPCANSAPGSRPAPHVHVRVTMTPRITAPLTRAQSVVRRYASGLLFVAHRNSRRLHRFRRTARRTSSSTSPSSWTASTCERSRARRHGRHAPAVRRGVRVATGGCGGPGRGGRSPD